jgi:hypothetical protein
LLCLVNWPLIPDRFNSQPLQMTSMSQSSRFIQPLRHTTKIGMFSAAAIVSVGLLCLEPSAHAGKKEVEALLTKLPGGFLAATSAQLSQAVADVLADPAFEKLKPGIVAGEALKNAGSNAQDAGDDIAMKLLAVAVPGDKKLDKLALAKDAVATAGKGKDLNVLLVPDFAAAIVDSNTEALSLASLAKSSKVGSAAVLGGRASELATQGEMETLASNAFKPKKEGGSQLGNVVEISQFIAAEVDGLMGNTATFANTVANLNVKVADKVGIGASAGDPTNASAIFETLVSNATLPKLKAGIAKFAAGVGNVADIEEIQKIGTSVAGKIGDGSVKFSVAKKVAGDLAKAIVSKTSASPTVGVNRTQNKQDELGELAAYMVKSVITATNLAGDLVEKKAGKSILSIITAITKQAKAKGQDPSLFGTTAQDVAGSVALTLKNNSTLPAATLQVIRDYLLDAKGSQAKKIGGADFAQAVTAALTAGFDGTDPRPTAPGTAFFEDGNIAANGTMSDPETDFRPF